MKNRTLIGIVCIAIAVVMVFAVSPLINRVSEQKETVVRVVNNVAKGSLIKTTDLEEVKMAKNMLPDRAIGSAQVAAGEDIYASVDLQKGDVLTGNKFTKDADGIEMALMSLPDNKVAMTCSINSINSLNGKLKAGDIVSLCVTKDKITTIPLAFKYVKVLTTTTSGGIDEDQVQKKEDGSFAQPSTVTLMLTPRQAALLASYKSANVRYMLVHRGDDDKSAALLAEEDKYLEGLETAAQEAAKQMISSGNLQTGDKEFDEYYATHKTQFINMMNAVFESVFGMNFETQADTNIYDDAAQAEQASEQETAPQDQATEEEEG